MKSRSLLFLGILLSTGMNLFGQTSRSSYAQLFIEGRVQDASTKEPLQYATISVFSQQDSSLVTGGITDDQGVFHLEVPDQNIYLKVGYLGYLTRKINELTFQKGIATLGVLEVKPDEQILNEVVVSAEKSQVNYELDKRVFNVGKDISSAGGSAMDVLVNVPSVDVNIEGEVSLRGNSNVQILVNGKPSVIASGNALGTISADMIEKVEVITNPSAKYDSEGTTGILNIVLKKEEKRGVNGSVTINTGIPNNHSIGLSLNKRTDRFNVFSQFGIGKRTFLSNFEGRTIDRSGTESTELISSGDGEKNEQFYNIILGTDFFINPLNVVTLSGHFGYEFEDEFSDTYFDLVSSNGRSIREEITDATNPKWQYELQYKKSFEGNKDRALIASATGSFFGKDQNSSFENSTQSGDVPEFLQFVNDDFSSVQHNFQVDYTHPFSEKRTLEIGSKYQIDDDMNNYLLEDVEDGNRVVNTNFTNDFDFTQKVLGIYSTYSIEFDQLSLKGGLRVENTNLNTFLATTNETNRQNYTDWFPTFHTSYKLSESFSAQLGYSRRISRPRAWSLNPFASLNNNLNLRTGNPDLMPEYTDSYELSLIRDWEKISLNTAVFYRNTNNVVDRIVQVMDSLTISTPQNVGLSNNLGIEVNAQIEPAKWLSLLGDFNWTYFNRSGTFENQSFEFSNSKWTARVTSKFKFANDLSGEIRLRYRSGEERIQSIIQDNAYLDLGIKKKLFNGRTVVNLIVRDVFSARRFISITDQPDFFRLSDSQRDVRRIVLGISYGFGKGDAMEFSGLKQF